MNRLNQSKKYYYIFIGDILPRLEYFLKNTDCDFHFEIWEPLDKTRHLRGLIANSLLDIECRKSLRLNKTTEGIFIENFSVERNNYFIHKSNYALLKNHTFQPYEVAV